MRERERETKWVGRSRTTFIKHPTPMLPMWTTYEPPISLHSPLRWWITLPCHTQMLMHWLDSIITYTKHTSKIQFLETQKQQQEKPYLSNIAFPLCCYNHTYLYIYMYIRECLDYITIHVRIYFTIGSSHFLHGSCNRTQILLS